MDETETYFLQYGVNFFSQPVTVLLIGGTIYHKMRDKEPGYREDLALIASGVLHNPEEDYVLRATGEVLLDAKYLVSVLGGLYGRVYPEQALRVMKRELVPLDVKAGDKVLFGKYAGTEIKIDGEELLMMKEDDILGVIE